MAHVKRLLPKKTKIGHTGTLDPLASGLLVLLIGRATRLSRYVMGLDKTYTATARFGAVSDTLDAEGEITPLDTPMPDEKTLRSAIPEFTGELLQLPPMASAIKVGGKRLYDLHRRGETVEREPRQVTIYSLELVDLEVSAHSATFNISCGSGTYVRTLIADLAESLDNGAYLTALRRNSVGTLTLEDATNPESLSQDSIQNHIIPQNQVVQHLARLEVDDSGARDVRHGRPIAAPGISGSFRVERDGELLAVYCENGTEARAEVVLCAE